MTHYTNFISDIHLSSISSETVKLFIKFLEEITEKVDALYILGDLFQFWVGDDDRSIFNEQIKDALKKASSKTSIYLMPGNRDFLLGENFAKESGCTLIYDPHVINLYGKKTVLTHGDILCTKDSKYWMFRKIIRFPYGIQIFLKLPLRFRLWLAVNIQEHSAKIKSTKSKDLLAIQDEETKKLLNKFNSKLVIHGHTHIAEISENRFSLGEWDKQSRALFYHSNHHFEL
jgi:UDP-2,3-diacylglucosamine hydrolase